MRLVAIVAVLVVAAALLVANPGLIFPYLVHASNRDGPVALNAVRYRLTIVLDAGGSTVTQSAVHQVSYTTGFGTAGGTMAGGSRQLMGQSLVFTTSSGTLFFILEDTRGSGLTGLFERACGFSKSNEESGEDYVRRLHAFSGTCTVQPEDLPKIVSLPDAADPRTLRVVEPGRLPGGAAILSAEIETTADPVEITIRDQFVWLADDTLRNLPLDLEATFRPTVFTFARG